MHYYGCVRLIHKILIIDAEIKAPLDFYRRQKITEDFVNELLNKIHMEKLGALQFLDATDEQFPGWSFVQPITTSHISGHYFEDTSGHSNIHIDLYSCKEFDWEMVVSCANKHFNFHTWKASLLNRTIDPAKRVCEQFSG